MMDIREKLVELLGKAIGDAVTSTSEGKDVLSLDDMASCLIANGVTVQEWIPVRSRLPEPFVSVLVHMPLEKPCPTVREGFITRDGIWHSALYDREPDEVTHWMPLPAPPKGE